jgi:uncharacterized protein
MKIVFADTGYWIALLYPEDALHEVAKQLDQTLNTQNKRIITSNLVLVELVNFFSKSSNGLRQKVTVFTTQIQ